MLDAITDVQGIKVGHWTDQEHGTGCTVVLCEDGAVGGVDVRGGAPGTRETDLLRPGHLVSKVHGILLSGGSAYGLNAAAGVMRYLEKQESGFRLGPNLIPIVSAAILFDLGVITGDVRPDAEQGFEACVAAASGPFSRGSVGAGTGATVGKVLGLNQSTKGGLGTASVCVARKWTVAALVAVNAFGDVIDPDSGVVIAGPRRADDRGFLRTTELMLRPRTSQSSAPFLTNTTLVVVATDAKLNTEETNLLAQAGHDGLARAVQPCHLLGDGDTVFALATARKSGKAQLNPLLAAIPKVVARAVIDAVTQATGLGGVPSIHDVVSRT